MSTKKRHRQFFAQRTDLELHQAEYVEEWLRRHNFKRWKLGPYYTPNGDKLMLYVENKQDLTAAQLKEPLDSFKSREGFRGYRQYGNSRSGPGVLSRSRFA